MPRSIEFFCCVVKIQNLVISSVQGLSLVDSVGRANSEQQRSAAAESALQPLFCAATAFRTYADASDPGVALARALLHHLRREASGEAADEGLEVRVVGQTAVPACSGLLLLFERVLACLSLPRIAGCQVNHDRH